jgi:hypothetical protein
MQLTVKLGRILLLPPIVPEGLNVNSRGREPAGSRETAFDPGGVVQGLNPPPWVAPTALRASRTEGSVRMRPGELPSFPA